MIRTPRPPASTVTILVIIALFPIWFFRYLPMTDLPEHELIAKILISYDDAQLGYVEHFTKRVPWNPYSTYFWFEMLLGRPLGITATTKLFITVTFVLTIISAGWWIRMAAPGREANLIAAVPLLYRVFFYIGMVNFLFSVPFLFFSLVLGSKTASSHEHRAWLTVGLTVSLLLAYFSHPVTFVLTADAVSLQALLIFRGKNLSSLISAGIPIGIIVSAYALAEARSDVVSMSWSYEALQSRIANAMLPFGGFVDAITNKWIWQPDVAIFWILFAACVLIAIVRRSSEENNLLPTLQSGLIAILLAGAVVTLPSGIADGLPVAMRASYPAAFAGLAVLPSLWYRRTVLRWITIAAAAGSLIFLIYRIHLFQQEVQHLQDAVSSIPFRQNVQPVITDAHSRIFKTYPFLHAAARYNFEKGGTSPYLFTKQPHFPVQERNIIITNPPGEWKMADFRYEMHHLGSGYFLVKTTDTNILRDLTSHGMLVAESGDWKVFRSNQQ